MFFSLTSGAVLLLDAASENALAVELLTVNAGYAYVHAAEPQNQGVRSVRRETHPKRALGVHVGDDLVVAFHNP